MIIYLHGFRSGPASFKARALAQRLEARGLGAQFACPQLEVSPSAAIRQIEGLIAASPRRPTLIGSSLGGFYATWLAEQHGLCAAVVNPAVLAPLDLAQWLGPQTNLYTGEHFILTPTHIRELEQLEIAISKPERYWLLLETGDEVLDYRHAVQHYAGARQTILPDGDHSFTRWPEYLDAMIAFAGLS